MQRKSGFVGVSYSYMVPGIFDQFWKTKLSKKATSSLVSITELRTNFCLMWNKMQFITKVLLNCWLTTSCEFFITQKDPRIVFLNLSNSCYLLICDLEPTISPSVKAVATWTKLSGPKPNWILTCRRLHILRLEMTFNCITFKIFKASYNALSLLCIRKTAGCHWNAGWCFERGFHTSKNCVSFTFAKKVSPDNFAACF